MSVTDLPAGFRRSDPAPAPECLSPSCRVALVASSGRPNVGEAGGSFYEHPATPDFVRSDGVGHTTWTLRYA